MLCKHRWISLEYIIDRIVDALISDKADVDVEATFVFKKSNSTAEWFGSTEILAAL